MDAAAIEVKNLRKCFGELVAVDDLSFAVAPGEVFAFLGPNGAGKSTSINILCTLAKPTSGSAYVAGFDASKNPDQVRRHIGLVFQEPTLDQQLTAEENLKFHAVMYNVPKQMRKERISRVLELVALSDRRKDLVSTFSGGMARRLEIARAMLHTPEVLFLDEPTLGLDPQTRALIWEDLVAMRREEGVTIFLTTHYMDEAEVADRIGIIDHGRLVALDTPEALKSLVGSDTIELHTHDDSAALAKLKDAGFKVTAGSEYITVFTSNGETQIGRIVESVGGGVESVQLHRPTLDSVFLHFTGREIRDHATEARSSRTQAWRGRR